MISIWKRFIKKLINDRIGLQRLFANGVSGYSGERRNSFVQVAGSGLRVAKVELFFTISVRERSENLEYTFL